MNFNADQDSANGMVDPGSTAQRRHLLCELTTDTENVSVHKPKK
jgi:hypothetical protein